MALTEDVIRTWAELVEEDEDTLVIDSGELVKLLEPKMKFPDIKEATKKAYADFIVANFENLSEPCQCNILSLLRILCRDDTGLGSLLTDKVCKIMMSTAFPPSKSERVKALVEAEKCIINSLFHSMLARDVFSASYEEPLLSRVETLFFKISTGAFTEHQLHLAAYLKLISDDLLEQLFFFDLRLCFVLCATQNKVLNAWGMSEPSFAMFYNILEFCTKGIFDGKQMTKSEDERSNECLKIIYNILCCPQFDQSTKTAKTCADLGKKLILAENVPEATKQNVVNILYRLDKHLGKCSTKLDEEALKTADPEHVYEGYDVTFPTAVLKSLEDKLDNSPKEDVGLLVSYFAVLHYICAASKGARRYCRLKVLPPLTATDVQARPDEGNSLRAKIIRTMMNGASAGEMAAEFLFTLCKQSPGRMMKYCGLGHAAGLFANKGLFGNLNRVRNESDSEDSQTEDYKEVEHQVNPVTGFINPARDTSAWDNMSEEQKEYEAMKLVDAMSKLMDTGVIQPGTIGPDGKPKAVSHVCELLKNKHDLKEEEELDSD
ncbi:hypothetical protein L596_019971 [Steinernema carpocapsae]|uniref:Synembryn n=1 Tax=Steinernema carpocapsae TaxID=34508 RepID=A0A4U5MS59_STECR|nr:hypothetical protein L596_019971 [Steinernema carpocapsae]